MGEIICSGECENCDFEHWKWVNIKGVMVVGNRMRLRNCIKVHDEIRKL